MENLFRAKILCFTLLLDPYKMKKKTADFFKENSIENNLNFRYFKFLLYH